MASLPAYDNGMYGPPADLAAMNRAGHAPGDPMLEHATQIAAPPGSTFKLVVGAADTVFGVIPPAQVIPTGYTFQFGDHTFHGWGPLPPQNLTQAIAWSNDVYFYKLALGLGPDRIHEVGAQVGAGVATGVDLPGENEGFVGTPGDVAKLGDIWYPGANVILGIGQGFVTATPMQVARWTAAVTTGRLITPHVGAAVGLAAGPGPFTELPRPAPSPLPFAGGLGPLRDGMRMAVTEGTAGGLRSLPQPAGAKTGSAEDPAAPGTGVDAWYTAALPVNDPEVVVTVFVHGGGEGHLTSEPVARSILDSYLAHRGDILAMPPSAPPFTPEGW
jgi:cell division protein FtsI/penicillin-binding protein 2